MTLKDETLKCLKQFKRDPSGVRFVLFGDHHCTFDEFLKASDFEYDSGYGTVGIIESLKIVGDDWWLERAEYDGSEWWEFKTVPTISNSAHKVPKRTNFRSR